MDTLQCAVVLAKLDWLDWLDWEIKQRIAIGQRYLDLLAGHQNSDIQPLALRPDRTCVWAQFTQQTDVREEVLERLKQAGIPFAIHYSEPVHLQPAYQNSYRVVGALTHTESAAKRVFSLPMHPYLELSGQEQIITALLPPNASII